MCFDSATEVLSARSESILPSGAYARARRAPSPARPSCPAPGTAQHSLYFSATLFELLCCGEVRSVPRGKPNGGERGQQRQRCGWVGDRLGARPLRLASRPTTIPTRDFSPSELISWIGRSGQTSVATSLSPCTHSKAYLSLSLGPPCGTPLGRTGARRAGWRWRKAGSPLCRPELGPRAAWHPRHLCNTIG